MVVDIIIIALVILLWAVVLWRVRAIEHDVEDRMRFLEKYTIKDEKRIERDYEGRDQET